MNYCAIRRSDAIYQSGPRLTVGIVAKTGPKSQYRRSFVPVVAIGRFFTGKFPYEKSGTIYSSIVPDYDMCN